MVRVPAGSWLPLGTPPSEPVLTCLVRGVQTARCAQMGTPWVCHERPQAVVVDADGMGDDEAHDWAEWMVGLGVGQLIESDLGDNRL